MAALCAAGLATLSCSGNSNGGTGRSRLTPAVEAVRADHGALPLVERLSGLVKANNQVEIYPEISAVVRTVHVENGNNVRKGQPLVSLRDVEFQERLKQAQAAHQIAQAQVRQAEARLKEAQADLRRTRALAEKGLTNEAELETVETQALSAEADVELARARADQARATVAEQEEMLSQTVIRSPIEGTVGNRNAEVGMSVGTSTRLFTLGQLDSVRVEIILTDLMLTYIDTGQRTEIRAGHSSAASLSSPLSRISPFLHPVTHSTDAEIDLANPDNALKSGMFVTVDVFYGESESATLVPLSALYDNPLTGATGVYVARDTLERLPENTAELSNSLSEPIAFAFVPVGILAKGRMSVGVRGIEPGSWVVILGQDLFGGEDGEARVRPVEWARVEQLQNLQREDLLEELAQKQQSADKDTAGI